VIKINVCLRADTNPFLAALYGRHPVRPAVRPTVDFRPTEASKAAIRYDRFTSTPVFSSLVANLPFVGPQRF
jgi:hypothetical protein